MLTRTLLFACVSFLTFGLNAQISFDHSTLADALKRAKKENKPVFVDVYATWCGPCKRMAATAFTDPKVADYYNANFINVKVDGEKGEGPTVMTTYGIEAYPTLLYFNPDGMLAKKVVGSLDAAQLLKKAIEVAHPESVPTAGARKAFHESKKSRADLKAYLEVMIAQQDDSLNTYLETYYNRYTDLSLTDQVELEVFHARENDLKTPLSREFIAHPELYTKELYVDKLNMFIQQAYVFSVQEQDFTLVETAVNELLPKMRAVEPTIKITNEEYVEYLRGQYESQPQ